METTKPNTKILKILLKEFTIKPTITFLAKEIDMSRVGTWKILKKLEAEKSGLIPQGIDALTGAHTEQGLRERLSKPGNKKENV